MTQATLTLADFLLARIAEDEAIAAAKRDDTESWGNPYAESAGIEFEDRFDSARVLAECEAKRRIIIECSPVRLEDLDESASVLAEDVLRLLAPPYASHPDFDPSWRL